MTIKNRNSDDENKKNKKFLRFLKSIPTKLNIAKKWILVSLIHLVLILSITHKKERDKNKIDMLQRYILKKISRPVNSFMPSVLAFSMFITLIPTITVMAIIIIMVSRSSSTNSFDPNNSSFLLGMTHFLNKLFGSGIGEKIISNLTNGAKEVNLFSTFSLLIVSLWIAISSVKNVIKVASAVYNEKYRIPFWKTYLKSFLLILVLDFFMIFAMMFLTFFSQSTHISEYPLVWSLLKVPLAIGVVYILLIIIFIIAPEESVTWKSVHPGSFVSSIILGITFAIITSFNQFTQQYSKLYGTIASTMSVAAILLILSYIIYYGFIINSAVFKIYDNPMILRISQKKFDKIIKSKKKLGVLKFRNRKNFIRVDKPDKVDKNAISDMEIKAGPVKRTAHKISSLFKRHKKNKNKKE